MYVVVVMISIPLFLKMGGQNFTPLAYLNRDF